MTKPLPSTPNLSTAPSEPLLTVGTIGTVVASALVLLVAFGAPLTEEQRAAVLALVAALAPVITAWIGRSKVFSPHTVARMLIAAKAAQKPGPTTGPTTGPITGPTL